MRPRTTTMRMLGSCVGVKRQQATSGSLPGHRLLRMLFQIKLVCCSECRACLTSRLQTRFRRRRHLNRRRRHHHHLNRRRRRIHCRRRRRKA